MSVDIFVSFVGFLGVLCGALSTYFIAVRKMSGTVSSTEATDLWLEARHLRDDATKRIAQLEKKVEGLEEKVSTLIREKFELLSAKIKYEKEIEHLIKIGQEQADRIEFLRRTIANFQEERRKEER